MKAFEKRMIGLLVSAGELKEGDLQEILPKYKGDPPLHQFLVENGLVDASASARAHAEVNGFEFVRIEDARIERDAVDLLSSDEAWRRRVLPVCKVDDVVTIVLSDPNDVYTPDNLRLRLNCRIKVMIAEGSDLRRALKVHYGPSTAEKKEGEPVSRSTVDISSRPTVELTPTPDMEDQGEASHRVYQRRIRQMRDSGEEKKPISQLDTLMEKNDHVSTVDGAATLAQEMLPPTPERRALERILYAAMEARVDEVEFAPGPEMTNVRFRTPVQWIRADAFPSELHGKVIDLALKSAGIDPEKELPTPERQLTIKTPLGKASCRLNVTPTIDGKRLVIHFPENIALLQSPLVDVGIPSDMAGEITARLGGKKGGALFVTSPLGRTLDHFYASLIRALGQAGNREILSLEATQTRQISGVTSVHCPDEEALVMDLENVDAMEPDVLGIQRLPNAELLRKVMQIALRGTSAVACFTAPDEETGLACFRAAGIDAMNIVRGTIGHLHIREVDKLCEKCRTLVLDRATLPDWGREHVADFYWAPGCDSCDQTGRSGIVYIADYARPAVGKADGSFEKRVDLATGFVAVCLAGEADPRDEY